MIIPYFLEKNSSAFGTGTCSLQTMIRPQGHQAQHTFACRKHDPWQGPPMGEGNHRGNHKTAINSRTLGVWDGRMVGWYGNQSVTGCGFSPSMARMRGYSLDLMFFTCLLMGWSISGLRFAKSWQKCHLQVVSCWKVTSGNNQFISIRHNSTLTETGLMRWCRFSLPHMEAIAALQSEDDFLHSQRQSRDTWQILAGGGSNPAASQEMKLCM